jgi:hypothetical protein
MVRSLICRHQSTLAAEKATAATTLQMDGLFFEGAESTNVGEAMKSVRASKNVDWLHSVIPMTVVVEALVEAYGGYGGYGSKEGPPKRALLPVGKLRMTSLMVVSDAQGL